MDLESENTHEDEIINLKARLWEVEDQVKQQENEIMAYQRRLWKQFNDLIDVAGVIREIEGILGKDRVQQIYLDYLKTKKEEAIKRQREIAETVEYGLVFEDLFHLSD
jgi:hypothetical protein